MEPPSKKSQRPLWKYAWYTGWWVLCRLLVVVFFSLRVRGREQLPTSGGVLMLSNHQSLLDPVLIGISIDRRLNILARDSLFRFAPFGWLIESFDTIRFNREGVGLAGLKETLRRLRRGEIVMLFPEGTRTRDGEVGRIKPGFCALARRAEVPLLPLALDGAYAAWPRSRRLPWFSKVCVQIGKPIWPSEVAKLSDDELVAEVQRRLIGAHAAARQRIAGR